MSIVNGLSLDKLPNCFFDTNDTNFSCNISKNTINGLGFCYWGAEYVSFKGPKANNGSSYENQAFWNFNSKALPVLEIYK
jgi:hypothetical protein